ncbi:LysM peptidoglycan-binding domain-containing protein [Desulforhopalus sp. IMCC35007]|uniref:LysM peptidoglycan-binding domain-containing protein n=1 Tax=Desulforhopalus sp. IMCC35007 TaxID=2569543 RepID=UPI0010AED98C|nr:LysM peptidoglycan-binding domain-containing protein [Desulforhopalus sp. IMCC35007]TKB10629.1 LysM peptidoglycan-binding domain-containing protein [Desulforhopalus sp. IMCC35007]
MTLKSLHFPSILLCFIIITFVSGCASLDNYMVLNDDESNTLSEQQVQDETENDPDLVESEPLMCLKEELQELNLTGMWSPSLRSPMGQLQDDVQYDFPVVINKQVQMYLNLFQGKQRNQFAEWLARSGRYKTIMQEQLMEAGLPTDLMYLSMIESGYYELACSRSKAVGLWQFMQPTGKQYNLKVDKYVDERRDAIKSTQAAVSYLSDLYDEFGDWYLAVAAYNGGPGTIRNGLRQHNVNDFWELASKKHLSLETKRYVPKLIAALIIAKDPERYGFTNINYQQPLGYDTITVGPGMPLDAIALISDSSLKEIKELNHELKNNRTPVNQVEYEVKVPEARGTLAQKNLSRLHTIATTGYKTHKIRKGDTLSSICRRYDVNKTTILKVNNLRSSKLRTGYNLRIPYNTLTYQLLPEGSSDAMLAYKDSLILHRIKKGETVSKISQKYGVTPEMIVAWNGLKNTHTIRAGQQLALYVDNGNQATNIPQTASRKNDTANSNLMVLHSEKKKHFTSKEDLFHYYSVRNGDSLWSISRKFSASTTDIKKWNKLKSNLIHPGSTLKLKKG